MCGICGIISYQNHSEKKTRDKIVRQMNEAIVHRGPDESGFYSDEAASLAMRRLSIIDMFSGSQPIFNETKDICIVFNGEIYNYKELRNPLLEKGHQFKTESDTEVLVHLYEEDDIDMLSQLKGMFAFCIYDMKKQLFFLARDRFGEKPLYFYRKNGELSFSSEIKSLLENKKIPRKLNHDALPYYFRTSLVPEPLTLLKDIYTLEAGSYLIVDKNEVNTYSYFNPTYNVDESIKTKEDAIELIKPKLIQAVARQKVSDVPIGAFLSGGIDSSTIVALLQQQSEKPIQTFNVRFEDEAFDESPIARKVADYYKTDHHEINIPNVDFDEDIFWTIIDHVGLPFRDSSAIPTYLISKEISKYVKVALSGDGGDELFGGYSQFDWYRKIRNVQKIPSIFRQIVMHGLNAASQLPSIKKASKIRQIKRGIHTSFESERGIAISLNEMFDKSELPIDGPVDLLYDYPLEYKKWSDLRKIMHYRLVHTLPANMLIKIDRMSMANSLEVRAPFLDPDLFDTSTKLPDRFLIQGGLGKWIIREMMKDDLPAEVFNHPKTGFSIPLHKYQNDSFKALAQRLLFDENPWPELIPKKRLEEIYELGLKTQMSNANISTFKTAHHLWMMMMLFGWAKRFNVSI